jgi:hypothetical protein
MQHYAKAALISVVVIAVVFRVTALRNAVAGIA